MSTVAEREQARRRVLPQVERARGFSGWILDSAPKRIGPAEPWSYAGLARALLHDAARVLDLGTGGGERFSDVLERYAGRALATEEWVVNVPVASERLRPLGAGVVWCRSTVLPFSDESFNLVLDRHEMLDPWDVARVLAPGGSVLTQQVDSDEAGDLRRYFPGALSYGDHYSYYNAGFRAAGLRVTRSERHFGLRAYTLEQLTYELCLMPWAIPGFDPLDRDLDALLALERDLSTEDGIVLTTGSYVIEAHKPS